MPRYCVATNCRASPDLQETQALTKTYSLAVPLALLVNASVVSVGIGRAHAASGKIAELFVEGTTVRCTAVTRKHSETIYHVARTSVNGLLLFNLVLGGLAVSSSSGEHHNSCAKNRRPVARLQSRMGCQQPHA